MAEEWTWDPNARRYRDGTGRFLSASTALELRDTYISRRAAALATFTERALAGIERAREDPGAWRAAVTRWGALGWRRVENTLITSYLAGRGGLAAMTELDRIVLDAALRRQRGFWDRFVAGVTDHPEQTTLRQVTARTELYARAGTGLHERARAESWAVHLPTYPGEQECLSRCQCHWEVRERAGRVEARWVVNPAAEHCDDCLENQARYNPLVIERPTEETP